MGKSKKDAEWRKPNRKDYSMISFMWNSRTAKLIFDEGNLISGYLRLAIWIWGKRGVLGGHSVVNSRS